MQAKSLFLINQKLGPSKEQAKDTEHLLNFEGATQKPEATG